MSMLLLLCACSSGLPKPPTGPVPPEAMEEVEYPPPAARVETTPPQTKDGDVWIDGQWEWDGKAWKWIAGAWTTPPAGSYFTPWTTVRKPDGRLYFARAAWRTRDGRTVEFGPGRDFCPVVPGDGVQGAPTTSSPSNAKPVTGSVGVSN